MSTPQQTATDLLNRAKEVLRADPKKSGILGVLGLVLVIMLGRVMLTGDTNPAGASASSTTAGKGSAANARTSGKSITGLTLALPDPALASLGDWVRTPIAPITRNLFAIKLDYYPQDGTRSDTALRAPEGNGFWDKLAKSMASKADQRKERQILVENLQLQAMQIKLQSTVMGATPRALVNGGMVREGDVVASFRVLKIEARRIIVEREGIKLEILMK